MHINLPRGRMAVAAVVSAFFIFIIAVALWRNPPILPQPELPKAVHDWGRAAFPDIYRPSIKPDDSVYKPYGAFEYKLPEERMVKKAQGEKLCILDMDSRPLDSRGDVFGSLPLSWEIGSKIPGPAFGILQHWLYAKIHGYRYYFIQTGEFGDRRASWKKPSVISRALEKHPTVVFLDSDAVFNHIDLPFEWLMNYWQINPKTDSISMATDPVSEPNKDEKGRVYDNTGFIVAQNRTQTFDLLRDWAGCADDGGKFPGCTEYREKYRHHPSDQGGFGNYVRYEWDEHIHELPCEEANGFPEHVSICKGTFVKHLWTAKEDLLKVAVGEMMPGDLLEVLHQMMMAEKEQFFVTEEEMMQEAWLES